MKLKIVLLSLFGMGMLGIIATPVDAGVIQAVGDLASSATPGMTKFLAQLAQDKATILLSPAKLYRYGLERRFMIDVLTAKELFDDLKPSPGGFFAGFKKLTGAAVYVTDDDKNNLIRVLSPYVNFSNLLSASEYAEKIVQLINDNKQSLVAAPTNEVRYAEYVKLNTLVKEKSKNWTFVSSQELAEKVAGLKAQLVALKNIPMTLQDGQKILLRELDVVPSTSAAVETLAKQVEIFLKKVADFKPTLPKHEAQPADVLAKMQAQLQKQRAQLITLRQQVNGATGVQTEKDALLHDIDAGITTVKTTILSVAAVRDLQNKVARFMKNAKPAVIHQDIQAEQETALEELKKKITAVNIAALNAEKDSLLADIETKLAAKKAIRSSVFNKLQASAEVFLGKAAALQAEQSAKRPHRPLPSTPVVASKPRKPLPSVPVVGQQQLQMLAESLAELRTKL